MRGLGCRNSPRLMRRQQLRNQIAAPGLRALTTQKEPRSSGLEDPVLLSPSRQMQQARRPAKNFDRQPITAHYEIRCPGRSTFPATPRYRWFH